MSLNGEELLLAILRQAVRDYEKLNPHSCVLSAEFFESEEKDFKTAEDFIFNNQTIYFGELKLSFEKACSYLGIRPELIKNRIVVQK